MNRTFQTYIDELNAAESFEGLTAVLASNAEKFGMGKVVYIGFPPGPQDERPVTLTTYPEAWCERYLGRRYQDRDPVIRTVANSSMPFEWGVQDDMRLLDKDQLGFFDEAAEFGIVRGFTVPVHHSLGQVAAVTFATDESEWAFRRGVMRNRHVLHLSGLYFHAHVTRLVGKASADLLSRLTRRELECLTWAARGKSSTDIATILSISRHTAVFHLENAKRKLGVRTAYQAIAFLATAHQNMIDGRLQTKDLHNYGGCILPV